jgi:hypothetical protein
MAKKPKKLVETDSPHAGDIYAVVGSALSYWEGAEDVLMGLYAMLVKESEPVAFAAYIKAPRKVRVLMLRLAIDTYCHRFLANELTAINTAIDHLDKLASVRNEIAHGHVSSCTMQEGSPDGTNRIVASGHYLLPSLNEGDWHQRTFRFHHTAETIYEFQESVRDHRWTIMQTENQVRMREQEAEQAAGSDIPMQRRIVADIVSRKIAPKEIGHYIRPLSEW